MLLRTWLCRRQQSTGSRDFTVTLNRTYHQPKKIRLQLQCLPNVFCGGGPFLSFLIRVARIFSALFFFRGALFFPKKLTTFLLVVVVTFKPTLNVQTSKQRGKNLAVDRGPLIAARWWRGASHGTTGTMVNPALAKTPHFGVLSSFTVRSVCCQDLCSLSYAL